MPQPDAASVPSTPRISRKSTYIAWPQLVCGALGTALSVYAYHVHLLVKAHESTGCSFSASLSCDAVIGSKYGVVLGLPLGIWGAMFFALIAITAVSTQGNTQSASLQRLALAAAGLAGSLGLEYIMWVILHIGCPVCMSIHAVALVNFLFALPMYFKLKRARQPAP